MRNSKRLTAVLLSLALLLSLPGCVKGPELAELPSQWEELPEESSPSNYLINTLSPLVILPSDPPKKTRRVGESHQLNSDTVGWLSVPGTTIDDVVVWYPQDENEFYYRRNFQKEYSMAGVYVADFRNRFGEGKPAELSTNTVIYGHTLSADIDGPMMAPLKYFAQESFARKTPYLFFSTAQRDMVWEVFAVFYATVSLPYNRPDLPAKEHEAMLKECTDRSLYRYDVQVAPTDQIVTLSTCTYSVPGIGGVPYPSKYRYVVMAKRVDQEDATKTEASLVPNPSPKAA